MYKVRKIKSARIMLNMVALIAVLASIFIFIVTGEMASRGYYARDVRAVVTMFRACGVFFIICAALFWVMDIWLVVLKKNGKVCSQCEMVYNQSTSVCPKCGQDLTYAINVEKFLAGKPQAAGNSPSIANNHSAAETGNTCGGRFCTACGNRLTEQEAFCPKCGTKKQ